MVSVGSSNVEADIIVNPNAQTPLQITGGTIATTQFTNVSTTVATLSGTTKLGPASSFNAQIQWDDGSTSTGQVVVDGRTVSVTTSSPATPSRRPALTPARSRSRPAAARPYRAW